METMVSGCGAEGRLYRGTGLQGSQAVNGDNGVACELRDVGCDDDETKARMCSALSGDLCLNSLILSAMLTIPRPSVWMANGVCAACFKGDWEELRWVEWRPGSRQFNSRGSPSL